MEYHRLGNYKLLSNNGFFISKRFLSLTINQRGAFLKKEINLEGPVFKPNLFCAGFQTKFILRRFSNQIYFA